MIVPPTGPDEPASRSPVRSGRLDTALVGLGLLAYCLLLTGDYFLPWRGSVVLIAVAGLLAAGLAARFYLAYRPDVTSLKNWLAGHWAVPALLLILLAGAYLRWQTLNSGAAPAQPSPLPRQALDVIIRSNWDPASFEQPPLYLYLGAVLAELVFVQQSSAARIDSPTQLSVADLTAVWNYVNLISGLLAAGITYLAAARLLRSKTGGVIAAWLAATSWLAYHATPGLTPQLLGASLAVAGFYWLVRGWQGGKAACFGWGGWLAGLATAATYGAVLLLVTIGLAAIGANPANGPRRGRLLLYGGAGWLAGWTMGAPGWILSLPKFISGLAATGNAPAQAGRYYGQAALANDLGLVLISGAAFGLAFMVRGRISGALWLALSFPLLYGLLLNLAGPARLERLVLVVPFLAIAGAGAIITTAEEVQRKLDQHDDRHKWGSGAVSLGLMALVVLISAAARRFL